MRLLALSAAVVAVCGALVQGRAEVSVSCKARPAVEHFFATLASGDAAAADELFAQDAEGWAWYAVADPAGQRLGDESRRRGTLRSYFASRVAQHERLRVIELDENANGNFGIRVERRADDLRGGTPVTRLGKGWVSCTTGKINVFLLGGAPAPPTFGRCPKAALLLTRDLRAAGRAALRFVQAAYSEMSPALDVRGARVLWTKPARGIAEGYAARVKCGPEVQRRTAVVLVRLPRIARGEPNALLRLYASRLRGGWLVWRRV
ncbi:MAG: hypothetical protein ACRDNB_03070 [Gaiellaceae bacterium]